MPKYSLERKEAVLSKLLSPNNQSFAELSREEGISVQTLYDWRNKARQSGVLMPNSDSSNKWDRQTKFTVVLETAAMNEQELSTYCREKGLYPTQIEHWREACLNGVDEAPISPKAARDEIRALKKDKKKLESQIRRKDKALAETAALLVLKKSFRRFGRTRKYDYGSDAHNGNR